MLFIGRNSSSRNNNNGGGLGVGISNGAFTSTTYNNNSSGANSFRNGFLTPTIH